MLFIYLDSFAIAWYGDIGFTNGRQRGAVVGTVTSQQGGPGIESSTCWGISVWSFHVLNKIDFFLM